MFHDSKLKDHWDIRHFDGLIVPEFEDPDFMKYFIFIIQRFPDNVSFDFNNFIQALNNF